jgi:hypothetical protein
VLFYKEYFPFLEENKENKKTTTVYFYFLNCWFSYLFSFISSTVC